MEIHMRMPVSGEDVLKLNAGDRVFLSGEIYTARDAAHKRMTEAARRGGGYPFPIRGSAIYYAGPAPAKPGAVIGSVGPTTSGRMDAYAPEVMAAGNLIMIGKGERSREVIDAIKKYGAVYLAAPGGAGALMARTVKSCEVAAYPDLGAEAVYRLVVENMPLIVAIDSRGGNLYERRP